MGKYLAVALILISLAFTVFSAPVSSFVPACEPLPAGNFAVEPKPPMHGEIPVLMYHSISDSGGPWSELCVSPQSFSEQLAWLKGEGYETVTLRELQDHWYKRAPLPDKPIVLTFDDGYRDNYTAAWPRMAAYGFRGVIFPYVAKFSKGSCVTPQELQEMAADGWEIGSHTYTHADLTALDAAGLLHELEDSKVYLEELLDLEIVSLCYPAGRYDAAAVEAARDAGYGMAVTTEYGAASAEADRLLLKRIRINRSDSLYSYRLKVQSASR